MAAAAEAQKEIEQQQLQQKQLEQQRQRQQQQMRDEEKQRQDALKLQRTSSGLSWLDEAMEAAKAAIGQKGGGDDSTASVTAAVPSGLRPRSQMAKKRTWREMEQEEEADSDYVPDDEEDLDEEDEEETEDDDDDLMDNSEEDFRHGQANKENRRSLSSLDDDSFLKEQRDRLRSLCRRKEKGMLCCPLCPWEQTSNVFAHLLEHMVVNHFYREIAGRHGIPQRHFGGKRGGVERGGEHPCTLCTDGRVFSRWVTITIIIF